MNTGETDACWLTRRGDRRIPHPAHHLFRRLRSRRWSPTPTWCCPTRPISNASTAISLLDRPISDADGAADAIRHPVLDPNADVEPARDVRGVPVGAARSRRAAGPARAWSMPTARRELPRLRRLHRRHERAPGVGLLAGWRGADGTRPGKGAPNPEQLDALHRERRLLARRSSRSRRAITRWPIAITCEWAQRSGFVASDRADRAAAVCGDAAEVPAGGAGPRRDAAAGTRSRARRDATSIRCRSGTV